MDNAASSPPTSLKQNSKNMMMDETKMLKIQIQTNKLKAENEALLLNQQIQELKFRNEAANMQVEMEKLKVENVLIKLKDVTLENEKLKETQCAFGGAVSNGENVEQFKEDLKMKDNDIKAKENEIKAKDSEIKARDGEIKSRDDEIKALKMKIGASSTTNHHNNAQTLFITDEMYFTEGVQRFIQGLNTRTNIYSSYDAYYKYISHKMQNILVSPELIPYLSHQQFPESYTVPYYQHNKCLFVKMECQNVKNIQFDISWLEYEHFTFKKEEMRNKVQQNQQVQHFAIFSDNFNTVQNTTLRNDRLVDRNWSHSGCTVLLLHKTDPMKCVQLSPQFMEPRYRTPGFGTTSSKVQQNYNQMCQCKIDEQSKLYGGVWQANLERKPKAEYFSFNREVYNVGSKSDLYFCVICCIKNI